MGGLKRTVEGMEEDTVLLAKALSKMVVFCQEGERLREREMKSGRGRGGGGLFVDEEEEEVIKERLEREGDECLRIANKCCGGGGGGT